MAHLSNVDLSLRWARQSERNGRDSKRKQAIKERTIPPQRLPQIFSRDVVSTVPLVFQLSTFRGKTAPQCVSRLWQPGYLPAPPPRAARRRSRSVLCPTVHESRSVRCRG